MRRACLAALTVFAAAVMVAVAWFTRVGTVSYANYERIQPGMSLAEVDRLVGAPGTEIPETELPGVVDWSVPVDHPKRVKAVVSGERYFRWEDGSGPEIIISLRGGVVAEKWYWEASL
jgi:hypothetical protein